MKKRKKVLKSNPTSHLMIVGLGNPGLQYHETRHNVGFDLIELLSKQLNLFLKKPLFQNYKYASTFLDDKQIHLVKPLTYMNRSGDVFPRLMKKYGLEPENVLVICDNMDLPCGRVRMKPGGSSAGQNGLKSIIHSLDSQNFYRLYIGIGRPENGDTVVDHVLGKFDDTKRTLVDDAIIRCDCIVREKAGGSMEALLNGINSSNR